MLTSPEVDSIKCIRIQIISNAVPSSVLSSPRVGYKALRVGPAHSKCRWKMIGCLKLCDNYLKIPLFVHGRSFFHTNIDVWPHTKTKNRHNAKMFPYSVCRMNKNKAIVVIDTLKWIKVSISLRLIISGML